MKNFIRHLCILCFALAALHADAATKKTSKANAKPKAETSVSTAPNYAQRPEVQAFIAEMVETHGFTSEDLRQQFARIHPNATVLRLITPKAAPESQRSWLRYRNRFVRDGLIDQGVRFWQKHQSDVERAAQTYNVAPKIIVAIIGVETGYGANMGQFKVLEALASLAFDYPPRAPFFRTELEEFLLFTRENQLDPLSIKGSYAGAIGIAQFMPSSLRKLAVDFDGNDRIDLRSSVSDALGSVAHYFQAYGWQQGAPIAIHATPTNDPQPLLAAGNKPSFTLRELRERGIELTSPTVNSAAKQALSDESLAALIDLPDPDQPTEYWLGFNNFYVITRYNHSNFYAMAVWQLAEAINAQKP